MIGNVALTATMSPMLCDVICMHPILASQSPYPARFQPRSGPPSSASQHRGENHLPDG